MRSRGLGAGSRGWLKQHRRIATRYEKRAANYLAMVTLGITMLWLTWLCRDRQGSNCGNKFDKKRLLQTIQRHVSGLLCNKCRIRA